MKDVTVTRQSAFQDETIDLRHYWQVLMGQKFNISVLVLVVTALTALIVFSLPPYYRATTTVLIENQEAQVLSIEDVYGLNTTNKEYYLTQFEILKSREIAAKVIRRLKLDSHPLFDPDKKKNVSVKSLLFSVIPSSEPKEPATEAEKFEVVLEEFINGLSIDPVHNTQLVKIHYQSKDPKLSAEIANTMADVYIESHLEAKLNVTRKATDWLSDRLGDLKITLQNSEQRLQEYREKSNIIDVLGVQTLGAEELEQLTERYVEVQRKRSEVETAYQQILRLGDNPAPEELMGLSAVLRHPLVQKLKEAQAIAALRVADISKRYGPKHPNMISATAELRQANEELGRQVVKVSNSIGLDYELAKQHQSMIEAQLSEAKQRAQGLNRKEFKLLELEREVQTNRQMYDMFMKRAKETGEAGGLQAAHARVVDPAIVPRYPSKPKKGLLIILAMGSSLVLGAALAFLSDTLNNTVRTPDDVEDKLHAPMLGFLPLVKSNKREEAFEGFLSDKHSNFAESIRTIRTGLLLSGLEASHKITVVTSSVPNEGKSTVALNLAEAVGQMEKVLLIDADMRRPTLAKTLDISRSAPGLSSLVAGTAKFEECVHRLGETSVDVLVSGMVPSNPLELLSSKRFGEVLRAMAEHYDRIIIDSAPTHAVSDALALSSYADALIYVVKSDDTPAPLAAKGIKRLRDVGAPITGVVLNKVDLKRAKNYGSGYTGYYFNYGYSSPS